MGKPLENSIKPILFCTTLLISLLLLGCKPNETTLTGQAFIVTRGGENIKLGLVDVLLIEKDPVNEFIEKKRPTIDDGIAALQFKFREWSERMVNTNDMDVPLEQSYGRTNYPAMFKYREYLKNKLQVAIRSAPELRQRAEASAMRYQTGITTSSFESYQLANQAKVMEGQIQIIEAEIRIVTGEIESLEAEYSKAKNMVSAGPDAEIIFQGFSPVVFQKATTDADGKFSFSYPPEKNLAIFAKAERLVGDRTEKYYWLVNAPSGVEMAQLFLSNNNFVAIDPDGYFKIKPKSEVQKSTP